MPGLRPPLPSADDNADDNDDVFYVEFNFVSLKSQENGQIIPVMTFDQIIEMLTNIEVQMDGDELAEVIIAQLKHHLKLFKLGRG